MVFTKKIKVVFRIKSKKDMVIDNFYFNNIIFYKEKRKLTIKNPFFFIFLLKS